MCAAEQEISSIAEATGTVRVSDARISSNKETGVLLPFSMYASHDEVADSVQQTMLLQEQQMVEIVEKTAEECREVITISPQLLIAETVEIRNLNKLEADKVELGLPLVDDLLMPQISRQSFSDDESITVNIVTQLGDSQPLLVKDMEVVLPVVVDTGASPELQLQTEEEVKRELEEPAATEDRKKVEDTLLKYIAAEPPEDVQVMQTLPAFQEAKDEELDHLADKVTQAAVQLKETEIVFQMPFTEVILTRLKEDDGSKTQTEHTLLLPVALEPVAQDKMESYIFDAEETAELKPVEKSSQGEVQREEESEFKVTEVAVGGHEEASHVEETVQEPLTEEQEATSLEGNFVVAVQLKETEIVFQMPFTEVIFTQLKEDDGSNTKTEHRLLLPVARERESAMETMSSDEELVITTAFDTKQPVVSAEEQTDGGTQTDSTVVDETAETETSFSFVPAVDCNMVTYLQVANEQIEIDKAEESAALVVSKESKIVLYYPVQTGSPIESEIQLEMEEITEMAEDRYCETETADGDTVTMHFSREYLPDEAESCIIFPALITDASVPDAESAAPCSSTIHEALGDVLQLHEALETSSHPVVEDAMTAKYTLVEDVHLERCVPYDSSVIVDSGDICAQADAVPEHLSETVVDEFVVDSLHINEVHASEQDECTLSLNEEQLCDNLTVVFPENVHSSLLPIQPSSSSRKRKVIDMPEGSSFFGNIFVSTAEEKEFQRNDNIEQPSFQLQATRIESVVIQMGLSDEGDTLIALPENTEFSETVYLEETEKGAEIMQIDGKFFQESADEGDVICEKGVGVLIGENREVDKMNDAEDILQLTTVQILLCDDTLVQTPCSSSDIGTVPVVEEVDDAVAASVTEQAVKLVAADTVKTSRTTAGDCQILEAECVQHASSSLSQYRHEEPTQQTKVSFLTETVTDDMEVSGGRCIETQSRENEGEVEHQATGCEADILTKVDREKSEATKECDTMMRDVTTEDSQHPEPTDRDDTHSATLQNEDELQNLTDLPWSSLASGLLDDDSTKFIPLSGDINKEDALQSCEASHVEREKQLEHKAIAEDVSSSAWKSSVVTRRVQRVSADGTVVERVKSEEVPVSFEPASLKLYHFVGDLPLPPDFSPQSDDRQSLAGSIKVYTDTVEGEPWIERRVGEVKETQPDGATLTRKVVHARQRRTVIKYIVIEGPEFEEEIFDDPEKDAAAAGALSTEVRGPSSVDKQLEMTASECKSTHLQSETDSDPRELLVQDTVTQSVHLETDLTESVDKTSELISGSVDNVEEDTTVGLPTRLASLRSSVSQGLSDADLSSQTSLPREAQHDGKSDCYAADVERDIGSVCDAAGLDNVESASSCGDFTTGISRYCNRAGHRHYCANVSSLLSVYRDYYTLFLSNV